MRRSIAHEWLAGRFPLPVYVTDPVPHRPHALLLFDPRAELIIATTVVDPEATDRAAARTLLKARLVSGDAIAPSVRVADEGFASAMRSELGGRVEVSLGPTPELEALCEAMAEALQEKPGDEVPSYLLGGDASPEAVRAFFEAAAEVYRLAPWRIVREDSQVLRLDAPRAGYKQACVSVVGQKGENHAVLVLGSIDEFEAFSLRAATADRESFEAEGPGARLFGVSFDAAGELPKELAREVKRHGWPVADASAYPTIVQVDADGVPRPTVKADYAFATSLLRALAVFLERHADVFRSSPARQAKVRVECDDLPGKPAVTLTAPHPGAYWRWGRESLVEHHLIVDGDELIQRFLERTPSGNRSAARQEARVVAELLRFKIRVVGEYPLGWHPKLLDRYLTEFLPREGDVMDEDVEATPRILDAFFAWLAESGEEESLVVDRIRDGIRRLTPAFLREARNPSNFSEFKKLNSEVRAAGIPVHDKRRLTAFLKKRSNDVAGEPAQPSLFEKTSSPRAALRKAWVWTPGTPAPDPKGPCPCGSSQRYKRCCMPR